MAVQGIAVALNVVLRSRAAQAALAGLSGSLKVAQKAGQGLNFGMGLLAKGIGLMKKAAIAGGIALAGMFASAWQSPALAAGIDKIKVALLEFGEIVAPILNKVIDFFLYAINAAKRFFQINRARIIELLNKLEPIIQGIINAFFDLGKIALETAHNIVDFIKESEGFQNVRNLVNAIKDSLANQKQAWIDLFSSASQTILGIIDDVTALVNKILGIKDEVADADIGGKFDEAKISVNGITTAVQNLADAINKVLNLIDGIKEAPGKLAEAANNKIKELVEKGTSVGLNLPGLSKPITDITKGDGISGSVSSGGGSSGGSGESARERRKREQQEQRKARQESNKETAKNIFDKAVDAGKKAIDIGKKVVGKIGGFIGGLFGRNDGGNIEKTGPYLLHAGERVVPRQQVASGGMGNVSINITTGPVNSQVDLRNLATLISREIAKQNKYGRGSVSVN